jgi:hypothetical protein
MTDAVSQFTVLRSLSTSQPDPFWSIPPVARVVCSCSVLFFCGDHFWCTDISSKAVRLSSARTILAGYQDFALDRGRCSAKKFASLYLFGVRASVARLSNPSRAWRHKLEREGQGIEK